MQNPSSVCNLHHSLQQQQILNLLSKARDQTCNFMLPSQFHFSCTMTGTQLFRFLFVYLGFFSPLLGESEKRFVNFVYIFKEPALLVIFCIVLWICILFISSLIFMISFLLLSLGFVCSSFSHSFRWWVKLLTWDFSSFLRKACMAMNFPLSTAFVAPHRFWVVIPSLSFLLKCSLISLLISSLTHWIF